MPKTHTNSFTHPHKTAPVKIVEDVYEFPTSFSQRRIWYLSQLQPHKYVYNLPCSIHVSGPLNVALWAQCLTEIGQRHESLRTTFAVRTGEPVQVISKDSNLQLSFRDLSTANKRDREKSIQNLTHLDFQRPFDLGKGPLWQTTLLKIGRQEYLFLLTIHHIIADAISIEIFCRELMLLYEAYCTQNPSPLSALPIQYPDYAVWQTKWANSRKQQAQIDYWKRQLTHAPASCEFPTDSPRPLQHSFKGATQSFCLPAKLVHRINKLSRKEGKTPFMIHLAILKLMLYRHTGQEDILIGTPIAMRNQQELEQVIGFLVNTLVLRTDLSGSPTFHQLLKRVNRTALEAYDHQDLPFERLIEVLQPPRSTNRNPLFQVSMAYHSYKIESHRSADLKLSFMDINKEIARYDISVAVHDTNEHTTIWINYSTDLYRDTTINNMLEHYVTLLNTFVTSPDLPISTYKLWPKTNLPLNPTELPVSASVPASFTANCHKSSVEETITARFSQQVKLSPDRTAIKTWNERWSYANLDFASGQIAHELVRRYREKEDNNVVLLFSQDPWMVAAMLGVLKAGKTYIPLDPEHPPKRLNHIIDELDASVILTHSRDYSKVEQIDQNDKIIIAVDDLPTNCGDPIKNSNVSPESLAYILYTSGSTGQPKGVMQTHRNALYHMNNYITALRLTREDCLIGLASYTSDIAFMDIYGSLLSGATLYLVNIKDIAQLKLCQDLTNNEITVFHTTPTVYRHILSNRGDHDPSANVRFVVLGGEAVFKHDVELFKRHFSSQCTLINGYGPSEFSIITQYLISHQTMIEQKSVPVGYPTGDHEVLLLDRHGHPTDVYGEIAVRSQYLSPGYWKRPDLNSAAFIEDPEGSALRVCKTGDMGRRLPNNSIDIRGRKDRQVKIRGLRIEPGEVESLLRSHSSVNECAVHTSNDAKSGIRLLAYIVSGTTISSLSLRRFLRESLPDYMIPSHFVTVEYIPTKPNGKIDFEALEPGSKAVVRMRLPIPPKKPIEIDIAKIWKKLLGLDNVSLDSNFFDLGGHSLLVIKAVAAIEDTLNIEVPFQAFYAQTLGELASSCANKLLMKDK